MTVVVTYNLFSCIYLFSLVDNLPAATRVINPDTNEIQFEHGYKLGRVTDRVYINNHLKLILNYHKHTE